MSTFGVKPFSPLPESTLKLIEARVRETPLDQPLPDFGGAPVLALIAEVRRLRAAMPVGHHFEDLGTVGVVVQGCKPEQIDLAAPDGDARLAGVLRVATGLQLPVTVTPERW